MRDPAVLIRIHGGLIATHELYAGGFDRHSVAALVRQREIVRARQGWFCARGTHPALLQSARVGGVATCRTALRLSGVWTEPDGRLHVAVSAHAVRLRTARSPLIRRRDASDPGTVVHWRDVEHASRLIVDPIEGLVDLARCGSADEIAAAADSMLRSGLVSREHLRDLGACMPSSTRRAILEADGICESGIETMVWRRLRTAAFPVRRQVSIARVGRVDFLLGSRLVVEVDGASYHADPLSFEEDRRRDAQLSILGYRVLRFSYEQVLRKMDEVQGAIIAAIARGDADE